MLVSATSATQGCAKLATAIQIWALLCGALAGIVFIAFPWIDLSVSELFYRGGGVFVGQSLDCVRVARSAFAGLFYLSIAAVLVGIVRTRGGSRTWLRLRFSQWVFLAISLAAGPGLVANVVLKDHLGRARPKQVVEFGGSKAFSPPLIPSPECASNCSFIGGEAASTFVPFYAASLVLPQCAPWLLAIGTLCGLASGLVRIAQGAHFLSDIIFAGVFMALTVASVYSVIFARAGPRS
jgi:lipid A 4'-phosphatase